MLEEARISLDNFLHQPENFKQIVDNSIAANKLRIEWLEANPQYKQYDLQLDLEWTGTSGISGYLWDYACWCCAPRPKGPHARDFKIVTRDWDDERNLSRQIDNRMTRGQIAAAREALECPTI